MDLSKLKRLRRRGLRRLSRRAMTEARRFIGATVIRLRAHVRMLGHHIGYVPPMTESDSLQKAREAITDRADVATAHILLMSASRTYPDSTELLDSLVGTTAYLGQHRRALHMCIDGARRHLTVLAEERTSHPQRQLTRDQRIFFSGYFYSGSGAVLDWFRGYENTVKWPPWGEMRLIKFPGGMADLTRRLGKWGHLRDVDLIDLYLHLTGARVDFTPRGVYNKWSVVNENSRRLSADPRTVGYRLVCFSHFLALAEAHLRGHLKLGEVEERFRTWIGEALDAAATDTGSELVLVDQAVTAWRMPIARLVPPSSFIVVHRDPRDQFAELREVLKQPGRNQMSAGDFAIDYRKNRTLVENTVPILEREFGHRFIHLSFEDFVLDHANQAKLLRDALCLHGMKQREIRFQPDASRRNIGKYSGIISPEEEAVLSEALPEFLDERVTQEASARTAHRGIA